MNMDLFFELFILHHMICQRCTVLCSISEFFHNSKICNFCKNVLLFVCILKGNFYFYLLYQFSAICLLENNNLFTFSKYFYHFYSKKCRQTAAKCNKIVKINYICPKKTLENGCFQKKNSVSSSRIRTCDSPGDSDLKCTIVV